MTIGGERRDGLECPVKPRACQPLHMLVPGDDDQVEPFPLHQLEHAALAIAATLDDGTRFRHFDDLREEGVANLNDLPIAATGPSGLCRIVPRQQRP